MIKLEIYIKFVHQLVEASAEIIRPYYMSPELEIDLKADETPVTQADRTAEEKLRYIIRKTYPDHGIIGEEFGTENETAEFVWVIDPIDGTKSFAAGCPLFGTLIGLLHQGEPILGTIHQPILDQVCIGTKEKTTLNGQSITMRPTSDLRQAVLLTTDIANIVNNQSKDNFEKVMGRVRLFRTWGDCYGYLLLAAGGADIMLDPIMNPWDLLPLVPIIQGAKGMITTWTGEQISGIATSSVAANKDLHRQVIDILNAV